MIKKQKKTISYLFFVICLISMYFAIKWHIDNLHKIDRNKDDTDYVKSGFVVGLLSCITLFFLLRSIILTVIYIDDKKDASNLSNLFKSSTSNLSNSSKSSKSSTSNLSK